MRPLPFLLERIIPVTNKMIHARQTPAVCRCLARKPRHSLGIRVVRRGSQKRDGDAGEGVPEDQLADSFQRELQKRNINSIDDIPATTAKPPSASSSTPDAYIPPPMFASGFGPKDEEEDDGVGGDQLARSRRIGSEGLDGLIPRGSQLLTLGATSFLAFGPFILFVLVSFGAVWFVWGDLFVHGGTVSSGVPTYYDPYDLLAEPGAERMIPM